MIENEIVVISRILISIEPLLDKKMGVKYLTLGADSRGRLTTMVQFRNIAMCNLPDCT